MNTKPCIGCGHPVVWAIDQKGTKVPLDPRIPVYGVRSIVGKSGAVQVERLDRDTAMASHFGFCNQRGGGGYQGETKPDTPASSEAVDELKAKWGDPAKNR